MRAKKRYVLLSELPSDLPKDAKFLFQNERGFVIKVTPVQAEKLRKVSLLISGSICRLKVSKSAK